MNRSCKFTGNTLCLQRDLRERNIFSKVKNIYLDVGKEEQQRIIEELWQKIGLTSRTLSTVLGWNRSSFFLYKNGTHRIPYKRLIDLCNLAKVDVNNYSIKFVELNNQAKETKLDLSQVDESLFQELKPVEWRKVVAVGFLTDGNMYYRKFDNKYMLRFFSSDKILHSFFQKLVLIAFNESPSSFTKTNGENLRVTHYHRGLNNSMVKNLLNFSKAYNTNKGSSPSLDFLLNEKESVKIQAMRFAMSCDGSVSIKKTSSGGQSFALRLACAHPKLNLQWRKLFQDIGIKMNIDRDKAIWSGMHGLVCTRKECFSKFAEIGGFLPPNVKVTNGNYVGTEKNKVLKRILDTRN